MLAPNLPPLPDRFKRLPIDHRGFPVPRFVAMIDGQWDFRVIKPGYIAFCHNQRRCWLCGEPLGKWKAFVIGPMCAINRINSEPPSHYECANFSCRACPFLTHPRRKRDEHDLPKGTHDPAGIMITRNPGVACLWVTDSYKLYPVDNGVLFRLGKPDRVEWWAHGRAATRDEVLESIDSGYPLLLAEAKKDGPEGLAELKKAREAIGKLLPAA